MTQKDYVQLAAAFKVTRPDMMYALGERGHDERAAQMTQWQADMEMVADVLAADNPRFNRVTFYNACGQDVVS